ncbi:hypothetical protein Y032_0643g1057 [Ancylostoma ceylanicum]|uniref:Mos1 transposase HTH domain-containing protein n=1 Tax=Ancylostoma ceylanicum TaxID=53326 RepID=A0A016WKA4_9BILA|nr:hypothetical protein Y032_0643g1057 [Ancylostoma ceylanicum]
MVSRRDFRVIILYEFKLSHSAAEAAHKIALAFGTDSPSERTVRCWFAKFSSGDFDLEDKPGRGRRMSLDDQALRATVETKPDTTTPLVDAHVVCFCIIQDCVTAKFHGLFALLRMRLCLSSGVQGDDFGGNKDLNRLYYT